MKQLFKYILYTSPILGVLFLIIGIINVETESTYSVIEMANSQLSSIHESKIHMFQNQETKSMKPSLFIVKKANIHPESIDEIERSIEDSIVGLTPDRIQYIEDLHKKKLTLMRVNQQSINSFHQLTPSFKILLSNFHKKPYTELSISDLDQESISLKQISTLHHFSLSKDFKLLVSQNKLEDFFEYFKVYEDLYHSKRNLIHTTDRVIGLPNTEINSEDLIEKNLES